MISFVNDNVTSLVVELRDPRISNGGSCLVTLPHHMSMAMFNTAVNLGCTLVSIISKPPGLDGSVLRSIGKGDVDTDG